MSDECCEKKAGKLVKVVYGVVKKVVFGLAANLKFLPQIRKIL